MLVEVWALPHVLMEWLVTLRPGWAVVTGICHVHKHHPPPSWTAITHTVPQDGLHLSSDLCPYHLSDLLGGTHPLL